MFSSVINSRMGSYPLHCIDQVPKLALSRCQKKGDGRPSMADAVRELENIQHMITDSDRGKYAPSTPVPRRKSDDILRHPQVLTTLAQSLMFPGSNLISGVIPTIRPL